MPQLRLLETPSRSPAIDPAKPASQIVPMYICPGAKTHDLEHALFPHGDGCSDVAACPKRRQCAWHAAYDIGGQDEFIDFPKPMLLPGLFTNEPSFFCRYFRSHAAFKRGSTSMPEGALTGKAGKRKFADEGNDYGRSEP